jgi:hypothetical protein
MLLRESVSLSLPNPFCQNTVEPYRDRVAPPPRLPWPAPEDEAGALCGDGEYDGVGKEDAGGVYPPLGNNSTRLLVDPELRVLPPLLPPLLLPLDDEPDELPPDRVGGE